jgi:hypothetical protein
MAMKGNFMTQIGLFDVVQHLKAVDLLAPEDDIFPGAYSHAEEDCGTYSHAELAPELLCS